MTCTPNHLLIELGVSRRKEGREIMKNECCHQHPDNGDLATQTLEQTEETDLRAINAQLIEALERLLKYVNTRGLDGFHTMVTDYAAQNARAVIEEAKERPR